MVNTINSNKENPVQNKDAFINLSYAPDVVNTIVAEIKQPSFKVTCDLGLGSGSYTAYGCDLSYEYVKINAEYRT